MLSGVVCVYVSGGFGECVVCVEGGGKVVFEEILRQLKILLGESNKAGATENLDQAQADIFEIGGMQRQEYLGSELVYLTRRLWTHLLA